MKVTFDKHNSGINRKRNLASRVLAGFVMPVLFMLSGCGNSDMDPLAPSAEISYTNQERETVVVERGDIVPLFEQTIELAGYSQKLYQLDPDKVADMETLYNVQLDEVPVSEGDRVSVGDTLLSFKSEVLDDKTHEWEIAKSEAILKK